MGEVVLLPVVRRESPELAAQDERRFKLTDAAKERARRKKAAELPPVFVDDNLKFSEPKPE